MDVFKVTAPCLLLDRGKISQLRVDSERYYPAALNLKSTGLSDHPLEIFVKKKSGHLSYQQDPHSQRSLSVQSGGSSSGSALELIKAFTEDPRLLAYAKYLCKKLKRHKRTLSKQPDIAANESNGFSMDEFCTEILHECLTEEKPEALPLYLSFWNSVGSMKERACIAASIWDVRLVKSFYQNRSQAVYLKSPALLRLDFVALLDEIINKFFFEKGLTQQTLMSYVDSHGDWSRGGDWPDSMGTFLIWHDVPNLALSFRT